MIPFLLFRIGQGEAEELVEAASLEYTISGLRLHWQARGAAGHYTMKVGRCQYDA